MEPAQVEVQIEKQNLRDYRLFEIHRVTMQEDAEDTISCVIATVLDAVAERSEA
jgi:hypothetical protein